MRRKEVSRNRAREHRSRRATARAIHAAILEASEPGERERFTRYAPGTGVFTDTIEYALKRNDPRRLWSMVRGFQALKDSGLPVYPSPLVFHYHTPRTTGGPVRAVPAGSAEFLLAARWPHREMYMWSQLPARVIAGEKLGPVLDKGFHDWAEALLAHGRVPLALQNSRGGLCHKTVEQILPVAERLAVHRRAAQTTAAWDVLLTPDLLAEFLQRHPKAEDYPASWLVPHLTPFLAERKETVV